MVRFNDNPVKIRIVGHGEEMRKIIEVPKDVDRPAVWYLSVFEGIGEHRPRIKDTELAKKLGYSQPHNIKKTIGRLVTKKIINPLVELRTVRRNGKEETIKIYWLTKQEAMIVAIKSNTKISNLIALQVVEVCIRAMDGLKSQPNPPVSTFEEMVEIFENNAQEVQVVRTEMKRGFDFIAEQNQDIMLVQQAQAEDIAELKEQATGCVGLTAKQRLLDHIKIIVTQHVQREIQKAKLQGILYLPNQLEQIRSERFGTVLQRMREKANWIDTTIELGPTAGLPIAWNYLNEVGGEEYREQVRKINEHRKEQRRKQLVMPFRVARPRED